MLLRRCIAAAALFVLALEPTVLGAAEPAASWVAASPDAMIDLSRRAALTQDEGAIARVLLIRALASDAAAGKAKTALNAVAGSKSMIAADARWLSRTLEVPKPRPWTGVNALPLVEQGAPRWPGLARSWALLGPFEDSGGGLARAEGPETNGHRFASADYSWGAYSVRTRRTVIDSVTPQGVPLDLYVQPRAESCTYLSTVVATPATPFVVYVATTGSFRLLLDGRSLTSSKEVHQSARVDRAGTMITTSAGDHLLVVKVCSGARADEGRVRVRFADHTGADLPLQTSSAVSDLDAVMARIEGGIVGHVDIVQQMPALARATGRAAAASSSTDDALVGAIAATLGGADDQRSRRAPGLLDRVVGDPTASADRLALAGWLAQSGANRSGWLTTAWNRAKQSDDDATMSFAQRALVSDRLESGAVDLARATAAAPPLANATDPHARLLRSRIYSGLGGSGLRSKALDELRSVATDHKGQTPLTVWSALARMAGTRHPSTRLAALQHLAEGMPGRRGTGFVGGYRMMSAGTLERMAMNHLLEQSRVSTLTGIGGMLLKAGRYEAAGEVFDFATELAPNSAPAFVGLAKAMRALTPTAPHDDAVLAALTRASKLQPQDTRLSSELRFRKGQTSSQPRAGEDAAYIVAPSVFLARAKAKPMAMNGLFSRQLHWRRVVRLHDDKRVSQLMHYARQIGVEPRTENERIERLPQRNAELLIARVHRRDGAVDAPEEQDSTNLVVRWPKLQRGDVVEVAVRTWTPGPVGRRGDMPFYFVDYVGSVDTRPVLYNEVVIDEPDGSPLAFDVIGGQADERRSHQRGGRTITHLVWNDPPSIADEPWAPRRSELLPVVAGSAFPDWNAFLAWYRGAVEGFTTPDEQIQRVAAEVTEGKHTRAEKVEALFNFVADDIRYVNFVSGEWWLPNRPQQLLARRQGDCDDKAMLLISLLRSVGIEANEVLVQTRNNPQPRLMQSTKVAMPMFDHGIIYLPDDAGDGGRFLDATSPQSRIGALPAMDSDAIVLTVLDGAVTQTTSAASSSDHGVTARWTLELTGDGSGTLRADEVHVGDRAFLLRTHLRQADTRAQWVEGNLIAGWFPGLRLTPDVTFEGELAGGHAQVRYEATSRALARREGDDLVVSLAPPASITAQLAPLIQRTLAVELPPSIAPHHRRMVVEVLAPPSHTFAVLAPDGEADGGSFGKATLQLKRSPDGRKVTMTRNVDLAQSHIEVGEYGAWRRWLQQVDGLLQRSVRLKPR